jgi:hypothetical protein
LFDFISRFNPALQKEKIQSVDSLKKSNVMLILLQDMLGLSDDLSDKLGMILNKLPLEGFLSFGSPEATN